MKYDFDLPVNRRGTGSMKWDEPKEDDIIPMWVADMDFRVAEPIVDAIRKRAEHGIFGYEKVPESYYQAVIDWFAHRHNWHIGREWMLYTTGVVPALSAIIKATTEPGDKVIVQTPAYNCFFSSVRNNQCVVEENPLIYENNTYRMDFDALEHSCAGGAKLLLLCNPHNPGGRVWTRDELVRMNEICMRHNVLVLADEIHNELVMPSYEYTPFASISEDCRDNSVSCNAPSKSFNIAGLCIANIVCSNPSIRERIDRAININEVCDVNVFGVEAVMAAYNQGGEWIDQLVPYINENHRALCNFFQTHLPQLKVTKLEGTYLAWIDIRALGRKSDDVAEQLLREGKVYVNSGTMYGATAGEGFIRINIACPRAQMMEGLERIRKVLAGQTPRQ